jgi:hypothetical protein
MIEKRKKLESLEGISCAFFGVLYSLCSFVVS